jgi:phospholipase C
MAWALLGGLLAAALPDSPAASFPPGLARRIDYVIVLYTENRSFDSLYGSFPGADGLAQAGPEQVRQTDARGRPLDCLPQAYLSDTTKPDTRFPPAADRDRFRHAIADLAAPPPHERSLANRYFDADRFAALDSVSGDMVHRFYTEQYQINRVGDPKNQGGHPMGKFVAWSNNPGLVMGVYDVQNLGEGRLAKEFVLCDQVFHSAFGGSFLNHFWLISARTPVWPRFSSAVGASAVKITALDANGYPFARGGMLLDERLTRDPKLEAFPRSNAAASLGADDYWAVNTMQPVNGPADDPPGSRLPLQDFDTIGDRLTAAGVTWAWFAGGWDNAKAGRPDPLFQYHHQPFAYFRRYALEKAPLNATPTSAGSPGVDSPASRLFLRDEREFVASLARGTLPSVSFVKPLGESSGHPGQSSVVSEQEWVSEMIQRIQKSPCWGRAAVFVIPDENGGLWDHVPPPVVDCWGPGTRVPMVIVSPHAKRGFVDHTPYETVSLLKFIELRWKLPPLNQRDADATAPLAAFVPD